MRSPRWFKERLLGDPIDPAFASTVNDFRTRRVRVSRLRGR